MVDQKDKFVKMGITAEFVSEIHQDLEKLKSGRQTTFRADLYTCIYIYIIISNVCN